MWWTLVLEYFSTYDFAFTASYFYLNESKTAKMSSERSAMKIDLTLCLHCAQDGAVEEKNAQFLVPLGLKPDAPHSVPLPVNPLFRQWFIWVKFAVRDAA